MKNIKKLLRPLYVPFHNFIYEHFTGPQRYKQLFTELEKNKPKNIMEVGVWTGKRAVRMIELAKKHHPASEINYYGFDLFEEMDENVYQEEISKKPPTQATVRQRLEVTGAHIHLFQGNTLVSMPAHMDQLPDMDFVYIDGGHSIETIANDWENTAKNLHPGSVVIFDDYWAKRTDGGCKPLIDSLDREVYNVEIMPIKDEFDNADFGHLEINYAKVTLR